MKKKVFILLAVSILSIFLATPSVLAENDINVVNSQDWDDVFSVMLASSLAEEKAYFVNSQVFSAFSRQIPSNSEITLYNSQGNSFIPNLNSQLISAGYTVEEVITSNSINTDLAAGWNNFIVISSDNHEISLSLPPLAKHLDAWVLIVTDDNLGEVESLLANADEVIAVGNFKRSFRQALEPHFDRHINEGSNHLNSVEVARLLPSSGNVVLTDGTILEAEFFSTRSPILLSGTNRILDEAYDFLVQSEVRSVIIVGNQLTVVGEQIRTRSNRAISVFVKFGQSVVGTDDGIQALTTLAMPRGSIGLDVQRVIYSPSTNELIVNFENTGNIGMYKLSTIAIKTGSDETTLASVGDESAVFLGAGEVLSMVYEADLPIEVLDETSFAEFFTSYGRSPNTLDTFLTMADLYSPPFRKNVEVEDIEPDAAVLEFEEVAYYSNLRRVGVTVTNNYTDTIYLRVKIGNIIVNGLETDLFRESSVGAGRTSTIYLPVELDSVDLEENEFFNVNIIYGSDEEFMLKTINERVPFTVVSGGITGLLIGAFTGQAGAAGIALLVALVAIIAGVVGYVVVRVKRRY